MRLPVLRQLFSASDRSLQTTDIVMLLTPRIVRGHELTQQHVSPIHIGTQGDIGVTGPPPSIAAGRPRRCGDSPTARPSLPPDRQAGERAGNAMRVTILLATLTAAGAVLACDAVPLVAPTRSTPRSGQRPNPGLGPARPSGWIRTSERRDVQRRPVASHVRSARSRLVIA